MSKEHRSIEVIFTVLDPDELPHGLDADGVQADLSEAIQAAVNAWYADRGRFFVSYEPI